LTVPTDEIGTHATDLVFQFSDSPPLTQTIRWEVTPVVRAKPPSLVIRPDSESEDPVVILACADQAFRVLGATGPHLDLRRIGSSELRFTHIVRFPVKQFSTQPGVTTIRFSTDHPAQPFVSVSLLVLPTEGSR